MQHLMFARCLAFSALLALYSCLAMAHTGPSTLDTTASDIHLAWLIDKTAQEDIQTISALPDSAFKSLETHRLPTRHHPVWLRFTLANHTSHPQLMFLDLNGFAFNLATLFFIEQGKPQMLSTGLDIFNPPRHFMEPTLAFPFTLEAGEERRFHLRILSDFNPHFAPQAGTAAAIHRAHFFSSALANGISGVLTGGLLYLLLISLTLKNCSLSIYFIAFLASSMAVQFALHHNLHVYLADWPGAYQVVLAWLQSINGILFIAFFRRFLPIRQELPLSDRLLSLNCFAYGGIMLHALAAGARDTPLLIAIATTFLVGCLIITTAFFCYRKQPYAPHFLLALCAFSVLTSASYLSDHGMLPHMFFSDYSYGLSNCLVIFVYSVILAHQLNQSRAEQSQAARFVQKATAESQAKSDFLAKMSHEIRTPLNGVMGMIQLLKETQLDQPQQAYIDVIEQSGNTLMTVINDILDYSKAEAGKMKFENTAFNVDNLLDSTCSLFAENCQQQDNNITTHVDKNLPRTLTGDPTRISQILNNLISNALKFTRHGQIHIEVRKLYTIPDGMHMVRFSVTDTGIGIDSKKLAQLFKAFEQADSSTTRLYGGTGLGLAICEQLTHLMHGNIGASSEPGKGSTFWFDLPLQEDTNLPLPVIASNTKPTPGVQHEFSDVSILVVEDNEINRKVIGGMLKQLKVHYAVAENGEEAVRLVKLHHENFDIILMDCEMPVMDGYTASQEIRTFEHLQGLPRLPIVALTAHAMDELRDKSLASGMDDHLAKPLQFNTLVQALSIWTAAGTRWKNHPATPLPA